MEPPASQARCSHASDVLRPYSALDYAWDEPGLPHTLLLELPGSQSLGAFNLDKVRCRVNPYSTLAFFKHNCSLTMLLPMRTIHSYERTPANRRWAPALWWRCLAMRARGNRRRLSRSLFVRKVPPGEHEVPCCKHCAVSCPIMRMSCL